MVAPGEATVGQLITVALTVTNHTTTAVVATPSIVVTGPVTAGNTPTAQSIPGGSTLLFQWTFTANAVGVASFTASVSGIDPGTGAAVTVPTATSNVTVQGPPGLVATLAIPATIELGDFTVTMLVSSTGGATAASVLDVIPDLPTALPASTAGAAFKSGPDRRPGHRGRRPAGRRVHMGLHGHLPWNAHAHLDGPRAGRQHRRGRGVGGGRLQPGPGRPAHRGRHGLQARRTGLVLQNGTEHLPITGNGTFTFATPVPTGTTYSVTVSTQPTNPTQTCTVAQPERHRRCDRRHQRQRDLRDAKALERIP